MTRAVALLAFVTGMLVSACEIETTHVPLPPSAAPPAPSTSSTARPRSRHYYVSNVDDVCAVFWEEGGRSSVRKIIACPREIEPGERMRLHGRTCMREGEGPERNIPIRCTKYIFYVEEGDREGKGEYKLAPKK